MYGLTQRDATEVELMMSIQATSSVLLVGGRSAGDKSCRSRSGGW